MRRGSRHLREKLQVLSAASRPGAAVPPGFDAAAGAARAGRPCRRRTSRGLRLGRPDAPARRALGWSVRGRRAAAHRRRPRARGRRAACAQLPRALAPGRPAVAWPSPRTSRSSTRAAPPSPGWRCPCPRTGRPRTRSAATSPRCMRRWPTTACCSPPATPWRGWSARPQRWERFVWTVTPQSAAERPPCACRPTVAGRPMPTAWPRRPGGAPSARPSSRCPTPARRCSRSTSTSSRWRRPSTRPSRRAAARRHRHDEPGRAALPRPDAVRDPLLGWLARRAAR